MSKFVLLDPVGEAARSTAEQTTRVKVDTLYERNVGFIFDGHYTAVDFWASFTKTIGSELHPLKTTSELKPNVGAPSTPEMLERVLSQSDLVVVGVAA